jgi:hypothetical protein
MSLRSPQAYAQDTHAAIETHRSLAAGMGENGTMRKITAVGKRQRAAP